MAQTVRSMSQPCPPRASFGAYSPLRQAMVRVETARQGSPEWSRIETAWRSPVPPTKVGFEYWSTPLAQLPLEDRPLMSERVIKVALLVTDVVMPQMSGKELSLKLKEVWPDIRVLYISGYTTNVISHHGILEAGVDYLQKPFSSFEFLTKVREILDRS